MAPPSSLFAIAVLALVSASCSEGDSYRPGERVSVTAEALGTAYAESEPAAQQEFGNRRLRVTGIVTGMGIDASENFVLRMKGPDPLIDVHLTIADDARAEAERIGRGTKLVLLCQGATEVLGSPTLDGCTFEHPPSAGGAKPRPG